MPTYALDNAWQRTRQRLPALKPGGWLVVEEMDFAATALDPQDVARTPSPSSTRSLPATIRSWTGMA